MNSSFILITFLHNIIVYNIPLLYGTVGEIMVEKSGSLNLGVEGTMAVGAMFGYIAGCRANSFLVGLIVAFISGALCGLIFAVLTVTLQANQNITGLTLTTFGLGVFFFVGKMKRDDVGMIGAYQIKTMFVDNGVEPVVAVYKLDVFSAACLYAQVSRHAQSAVGLPNINNVFGQVFQLIHRRGV